MGCHRLTYNSYNNTEIPAGKYSYLGNVLNVVTDRKLPIADANDNTKIAYFTADVVSFADYLPYGQLAPNRHGSEGSYRYGYQGSERDDELKGDGNSYTTFYRALDVRLGRWMSLDPKMAQTPWESPYASMGNNPIFSNDVFGDKIIGLSKRSATRTKDIIKKTFSKDEHKEFRGLIKIGEDGKTFEKISQEAFDKATKNFSEDEKALANGYLQAINDDKKHRVGVLKRDEKIGSYIPSLKTNIPNIGLLSSNNTGSDIDNNTGGGYNTKINENEDLTVIILDSKVPIMDNVNKSNGQYQSNFSVPEELLAHEMLGHGLTRYNNSTKYSQWLNAIRLTNITLRVMGVEDRYRDGSQHGGFRGETNGVNDIPQYLKR